MRSDFVPWLVKASFGRLFLKASVRDPQGVIKQASKPIHAHTDFVPWLVKASFGRLSHKASVREPQVIIKQASKLPMHAHTITEGDESGHLHQVDCLFHVWRSV